MLHRGLVALAWVAGSACAEPEPAYDVPVDCGALPETPADIVTRIESGEVVLTEADVPAGMAQAILTIEIASETRWYSPPARGDTPMWSATDNDGKLYRCAWIELECEPGAALHVCFWPERDSGEWGPGRYRPKAINFASPTLEQGGDGNRSWSEGVVVISAWDDRLSSGHLDGRGGGTLKSHITQDVFDFQFTVEALAFHDYARE